ncbi:unnamed protein product [Prorocentrum cordatum]|uniref:Protein kinase domain-containing protein n=1 Tax=Prorocentrum cordatum TaxID=2364126 RepID=A0ABN9WWW7_9DINO|nr:unnamed protein product [Polarella glacialis]
MGAREVRLPSASSQAAIESYVSRMASQLPAHFAFATLVPWSSPQRPSKLATPDSAPGGHWDAEGIASLASECGSLLVPCTFETRYEKYMMKKLLEQLEPHGDLCVFVLQLLEVWGELSREYVQEVMARHDALVVLGANAVVLDPSDNSDRLLQTLDQEQAWLKVNAKRVNTMIDRDEDEFQRVLDYHHKLLWEDVPKALMSNFDPIDRNLVETANRVGDYHVTRLCGNARSGNYVLLASRSESEKVVLKIYDKSVHVIAADLHCIYRELRFLRDMLRHPHIIRCNNMFHSFSQVYLALEFGGKQNLHQRLWDQPGFRLDSKDAVDCTMQIAGALAYCHSQDVVHGQVSLKHIVMEDQSETLFCRLVDFFQASHRPESMPLATPCGDLPCIAPEVALDESYFAKPADCWSLGVVLLEAAGGLGSMRQAVGWPEDAELEPTARRIKNFFSGEGSHGRALAVMGGVRSELVLANLSALLEPTPTARAAMGAIAQSSAQPRGAAEGPEGWNESEHLDLSPAPSLPIA